MMILFCINTGATLDSIRFECSKSLNKFCNFDGSCREEDCQARFIASAAAKEIMTSEKKQKMGMVQALDLGLGLWQGNGHLRRGTVGGVANARQNDGRSHWYEITKDG